MTGLAAWYAAHGRHDLVWRRTRDRWAVLVSEVMLHQTQVPRVEAAWGPFMQRFPTPDAMAAGPPGAVIDAWGRLGYPRRARHLWDAARVITDHGWPDDLAALPGVGRYTAAAVAAQVDDADAVAIDVNIRRVVERVQGGRLTQREAEDTARRVAGRLHGRDRLLALMDVGALVCRPRNPRCADCPLLHRCEARGPQPGETRNRQAPYEGSFRQRRGRVLECLRAGRALASELDQAALNSLVADGLALVERGRARLP